MSDRPADSVDPTADNPYEGVPIDELPEWWQQCLQEFEAHDLHTYVPAHFTDGKVTHEVIRDLESTYGVDISLLRVGGGPGDEWTVKVDGTPAGSVPRRRLRYGVSIVDVDSERFVDIVRAAVPDQRGDNQ